MSVATAKKKMKNPEHKALAPVKDQLTMDQAEDVIQAQFMEVVVRVNWLTTQKQIEEKMAAKMRGVVSASKKGLSLAKRLFDAGHPAAGGGAKRNFAFSSTERL